MKSSLAAAILLLAAAPAAADGFSAMARELASQAKRAGISRVAVLPLRGTETGRDKEGWTISERLVTQLVRAGKVQAVERSLLEGLMGEQSFARSGAVAPGAARKLGRLLEADGVVTGSFVPAGSEVVVDARLVDVESGVIVAAVERRVERDWLGEEPVLASDGPIIVPAPRLSVPAPELRDAPADGDVCANAEVREDALESSILDLKARYWALKLRSGLDPRQLKENPGSTINDPQLRADFYDRLKAYYRAPEPPTLTEAEVKRFVETDGAAYALYRECD